MQQNQHDCCATSSLLLTIAKLTAKLATQPPLTGLSMKLAQDAILLQNQVNTTCVPPTCMECTEYFLSANNTPNRLGVFTSPKHP